MRETLMTCYGSIKFVIDGQKHLFVIKENCKIKSHGWIFPFQIQICHVKITRACTLHKNVGYL